MATVIKCPHCKKPVDYSPENPYRPFCSQRCRLVDLGQWLEEGYKIPDSETPVAEENGES